MIKSGCDIVKISRMEEFLKKGGLSRCFSEKEEEYILSKRNHYETAAGIFAAKEALGKALGHGLASFSVRDAEVLHNEFGAPYFSFNNGLFENFDISLSISHDGDYALAFVVLQER